MTLVIILIKLFFFVMSDLFLLSYIFLFIFYNVYRNGQIQILTANIEKHGVVKKRITDEDHTPKTRY